MVAANRKLNTPHPVRALGRRLDVARRHNGWTYREFERRTGVSKSTLQYMIQRRRTAPDYYELVALVDKLGETWDDTWARLWQSAAEADPGTSRRSAPPLAGTADPARAAGTQVPGRVGTSPPPAHRQLPMDIAEFSGRTSELRRLGGVRDSTAGAGPIAGTAVAIWVIEGMAGAGKTRLAVHAAHQIVGLGQFDEIQLWVDLRGFDPERASADPSAVLAMFLRLLGVPGEQIPHDLDSRAALYRDRLHGKRALVLLDNAASEDQVRPLLPGSPTCLVLITSRRSLPGLDGAQPMRLDVFTEAEAVDLLARIAGDDRVAAHPTAAADVAELCGYLPLAVTLSARLLQTRPAWTLADLAVRLAAADQRLSQLAVGTRGVRAAFDLSYRALRPDQRRMFRLLGLHPGVDFTARSAAALANVAPELTDSWLEELLDNHLVQQTTPGRYSFHDLLRAYAIERAHADEPPPERGAAIDRVLSWYLHTADVVDRTLAPMGEHVPLTGRATTNAQPVFNTQSQALDWCRIEHVNLMAATHTAVEHGLHDLAWRIPVALKVYLNDTKPWSDWVILGEIALASARLCNDRYGEARALNILGNAYWDLRRFDETIRSQEHALTINREIGHRHGEGMCLNNIGACYQERGEFEQAIVYYSQALAIQQDLDDFDTLGSTLTSFGEAHHGLGRFQEAADYYTRALTVLSAAENRHQGSFTLTYLAHTYTALGQWDEADNCYAQALAIHRATMNRYGQAETLIGLADILDHYHRPAEARQHRRQALTILDELHAMDTDKLRTRIATAHHHPGQVTQPTHRDG